MEQVLKQQNSAVCYYAHLGNANVTFVTFASLHTSLLWPGCWPGVKGWDLGVWAGGVGGNADSSKVDVLGDEGKAAATGGGGEGTGSV